MRRCRGAADRLPASAIAMIADIDSMRSMRAVFPDSEKLFLNYTGCTARSQSPSFAQLNRVCPSRGTRHSPGPIKSLLVIQLSDAAAEELGHRAIVPSFGDLIVGAPVRIGEVHPNCAEPKFAGGALGSSRPAILIANKWRQLGD